MKDQTFMRIAKAVASESKCCSLKVGAVIVKNGRVISTGVNGTPSGHQNCCDHAEQNNWLEDGVLIPESRILHREYSKLYEVHAEMNAIVAAARNGISIDGCTMYVTHSPCNDCSKSICQTGIDLVVYEEEYSNADPSWKSMLLKSCKVTRLKGDINEV